MVDRTLTVPEAIAASLVSLLSAVIAVAYLWARLASLSPYALLGFTLATGLVLVVTLTRRASRAATDAVWASVLGTAVFAWLLFIAWPTLLPPGSGPDLTHHLVLVDFIERRWTLPDAALGPVMGEMAHYTPGLHLVAALAGAWTRSDGLHAVYTLVAFSVAIKCVFVFCIARRTMPSAGAGLPLAVAAVLLCLLPKEYFLGSFARDSFLAQAFAEVFAVAMWWSAVVWDQQHGRLPLILFAMAGIGAFLAWPVWIGAPVVTLAALMLPQFELPLRERISGLTLALAPVVAIATVHALGRIGWLGMAATSGAVVAPAVSHFGGPFVALATIGSLFSALRREARVTLLFTLAIVVQALTLYAVATSRGATTPYMAFKMVYVVIYPLAVMAAMGMAVIVGRLGARWSPAGRDRGPATTAMVWALLLIVVVLVRKPLVEWPRQAPIVSSDLYDAGKWARGNVEAACVDYLVPHADTMYWLHLAVLGNSRSSPRSADPDTFVPARAVARWLEPGGLPYAIVDRQTLPRQVASEVDVLEEFGTAAVVKRRGPAYCADLTRFASRRRTIY